MTPSAALAIVRNMGGRNPYDSTAEFAISGQTMNELRDLTLRLGTDQRMTSDEMRDWMNLLHLRLGEAIDLTED